jgi:hypothetical protein
LSASDQDKAGDLLIQEVDEDLRREQYLKLWQAYGKYAIAGAVAIVLAVAGHGAWLYWKEKRFQADAARYQAAETLLAAGKQADAAAKLGEIMAENKGGFSMLAGFRRAEMQVEAGDVAAAIASYEALSHSNAPQVFRDLAVVKGAMLALDKDDPEALAKRLQPISEGANPWRFTASELLALLANRRGDKAQAATLFKRLADDPAAPQSIRARAAEMSTLLGGAPQAGTAQKG